jgi:CRP/FNR family cyclic AMP-dependent transcriptional regulator
MAEPFDFLAALSDEERRALETTAARRRYAAGSILFHQGDDAGVVLVILTGRAKTSMVSPDGKEVVLGFPGPGELVGELSAIEGGARAATMSAVEDLETLALPGSAFRNLLESHPRLALVLWQVAATRLRGADRQRLEFAAYDVTGRVARRLVELADEQGADDGAVELDLALSHEELAAWTAASREAVSRALMTLRQLGWIETRRRRIAVLDLPALRRYAE